MIRSASQGWMGKALLLAATFSLVFGASVGLFPTISFIWLGLEQPGYTPLWRSAGLLIGVHSVGYVVAASAPLRHWPIVLVGLLANVLAPIGLLAAAVQGALSWTAVWIAFAAGAIWWIPFGLILRAAMLDFAAESGREREARDRMMLKHMTQQGYSLFELSQLQPTLVVFLRHSGCTFCREALRDLSSQRKQLQDAGVQLAFVTMSEEPSAQAVFDAYGLGDAPRISDPTCELYRAFDLRRGGWGEMFAPRVWWRGLKAGLWEGNGVGVVDGDSFRMPGVFLIRDGRVIRSYRHASPADRPNYMELATCDDCGPLAAELQGQTAS